MVKESGCCKANEPNHWAFFINPPDSNYLPTSESDSLLKNDGRSSSTLERNGQRRARRKKKKKKKYYDYLQFPHPQTKRE